MKFRITIEYELDGDIDVQSPAQEQEDWIKGNVDFIDIWQLFCSGDLNGKVAFETLD